MRNKLLLCLVVVFFVLQLYVFVLPVYTATCTADCGDGISVSCTGAKCSAEDGSGCAAYDREGNLRSSGTCHV